MFFLVIYDDWIPIEELEKKTLNNFISIKEKNLKYDGELPQMF